MVLNGGTFFWICFIILGKEVRKRFDTFKFGTQLPREVRNCIVWWKPK